jgi:hypothetical protein
LSIALLAMQTGCLAVDHGVYLLSGPPGLQVITIEFPAVDIPPAATGSIVDQPAPIWTLSPIDGWVHGFSIELTDANGDTVPSSLLHHVKVMTPGRRELFNPIMLRLVGAGSETRAAGVPRSIGFPIQRGDSLLATAMIHSGMETGYEEVRLRVRLDITPAIASPSPESVYPFFLHVTSAAGNSEYDLPPGRSERSLETSPAVAGEIVGFGGHTHRYAVELRFEDITTGKLLWRSRIRHDLEGNVLEIPRTVYAARRGPMIFPDRVYRLTVVYENPTGETLIEGGMGTLGGMMRPRQEWPEVNRNDPLYVLDRARELNSGAIHAGHNHE